MNDSLGAGSGIGQEVCLAVEKLGSRIVATDINFDSAEETISKMTGKLV